MIWLCLIPMLARAIQARPHETPEQGRRRLLIGRAILIAIAPIVLVEIAVGEIVAIGAVIGWLIQD